MNWLQSRSKKQKRWIYGIVSAVAVSIVALLIAVSILSRRFEPLIREQAIAYLSERFDCDVELAALRVHLPKLSPINILLKRGRGATARVEGEGISMRYREAPDRPHLFKISKFSAEVDLGSLVEDMQIVDKVNLQGMEINVPPKEERRPLAPAGSAPQEPEPEQQGSAPKVLIRYVAIKDARLVILPRDRAKVPLDFDLQDIKLETEGPGKPMRYDAHLTNPKPPGQIHATGTFGPWVSKEPSASALTGDYKFENADLGIFNGIAGILNSTGHFEGALASITAKGQATVPDFRLKMSGNPVPLSTTFEVLVDGTNGNTVLKPVHAKLGSTEFRTSGGVIKHEGDKRRSIDLDVLMPNGNLRDILTLAMKGKPFMEGNLYLKTLIAIPPLSGKVREKLRLRGQFKISNGKFLKSNIQNEIDKLSRRGQGDPNSQEIDEVVSGMNGRFNLENERIHFSNLAFSIPGAAVDLAGTYNMHADEVDFLGTLKLQARVSQTMTGWKRIALKPVDPFFAKNGAGTFLRISIQGDSKKPKFGLARNRKNKDEK